LTLLSTFVSFESNMATRTLRGILFLIAALLPVLMYGQGSAVQSVSLQVQPVTKLGVSGNPGSLVISDAVAGVTEMSVQDNSSAYNLTTNLDNMKIVASIDNPMPAGTRLMMNLASSNGISAGLVDVSNATLPVNVVTGIGRGAQASQTIAYVFSADAEAGGIPSQTRTITLTLTN
jgi:hypothetical protein